MLACRIVVTYWLHRTEVSVRKPLEVISFFFFFNDTATTEIYTLSLHDALPILARWRCSERSTLRMCVLSPCRASRPRSEEHTSELQSQSNLVCRLLLEKKKNSRRPSSTPCRGPKSPPSGPILLPATPPLRMREA